MRRREGREPRGGAVRGHRAPARGLLEGGQRIEPLRPPRPIGARPSFQALKLGRGTSQHVLIAGRTGSGKSTLLHALITNAALIYGPDEVELYLIDFKKGVEFKTYATQALPHARVVAIESEREFGLSVLQRLDAELKVRGDIYRDLGVQDLAGYRAASPGTPMPRLLLIVDEFQEFFVEDDKLAQEVALLLDRLVRQGRAFGIHVNLGSQTLSGAYSLARSTLGQMAVRIALQCSEADAHLILNEDNAAARLLSRPGEAIYNDANGQVEGNHIFQVVFLTDAKPRSLLEGGSLALAPNGDRNIALARRSCSRATSRRTSSKHPIFSAGGSPGHEIGRRSMPGSARPSRSKIPRRRRSAPRAATTS